MITGVPSVAAVCFDGGDQIEIVLGRAHRRHEDVQAAVARLDAERGAHDAFRRVTGPRRHLLR